MTPRVANELWFSVRRKFEALALIKKILTSQIENDAGLAFWKVACTPGGSHETTYARTSGRQSTTSTGLRISQTVICTSAPRRAGRASGMTMALETVVINSTPITYSTFPWTKLASTGAAIAVGA